MNRFSLLSPLMMCILLLLTTIGMTSCEENTPNEDPPQEDSLMVITEDLTERPSARAVPEPDLLGVWTLAEMWVGSEKLPNQNGEVLIEIKEDGTLVSQAPNLSAVSSPYLYDAEVLQADALGPQAYAVTSLTATELVLAYEVDGEQVRNVYQRKQ